MSDRSHSPTGPGPQHPEAGEPAPVTEHINIKVADRDNEVFFKIKRSTPLKKLMDAFCQRQALTPTQVRFITSEGQKVTAVDTPDTLDMEDGDTLQVHQEQIGGSV
ncbi:ubiquitin-like protein-like protein SMT3 [Tothia fuscella]|uniref:Ubiquitin-like protein-like protein SMT3 n=1 Tax=Tothia fuscella TaxID=1048955 RepID=A0A9P4U300_9PEZI|nr:ubiquitin-like protein-like protein SMT3 [Tothia fuscella]